MKVQVRLPFLGFPCLGRICLHCFVFHQSFLIDKLSNFELSFISCKNWQLAIYFYRRVMNAQQLLCRQNCN